MTDDIRRAAEAIRPLFNGDLSHGTTIEAILREHLADLARKAAAFDDLVDKLGLLQMALVAPPGMEWSIRLSPGMVMEIKALLRAVEAAKEKS